MKIIKNISRKVIFPLTLLMGVDRLFLKNAKKSCCIINFHGVRSTNDIQLNNRHLTVLEFEKLIIYLKRTFDIIPLTHLFELHRKKKKVHKKTISLTFDDGYLNNFEIAFPVLKKHNVPATFYIISKCLQDSSYVAWPDLIDVFMKHQQESVELNSYHFEFPSFFNNKLALDLPSYLKTCGSGTESLANSVVSPWRFEIEKTYKSTEILKLIDRNKISNYAFEPLIEFGSHSHTHPNFEYLNEHEAMLEFTRSKETIEETIAKKIVSFAFPDGSYKPETIEYCKSAGYENIVAVNYHHNEKNQNPNLLSRFTISNSTTAESNILRLVKDFDKFGF